MSTSGIGRGVVIVDTFCDAHDEHNRACRFAGRVDVLIDTDDNSARWICPWCEFEHFGRASDIFEEGA